MTITASRAQRRQLARDNAKQPAKLELVPRELWPTSTVDVDRLRVWRSREFVVQEFTARPPAVVRLSVNSTTLSGDRWQDGITWDDLQRIKNECGYALYDAVEIYPAQTDVVNVANMRHLWVMREKVSFAFVCMEY